MTISTQQAGSVSAKHSAPAASQTTFMEAALEQALVPNEIAVNEGTEHLPSDELSSDEVASSKASHDNDNDIVSFQLPAQLAQVFRAGAGDELSDFASYALRESQIIKYPKWE